MYKNIGHVLNKYFRTPKNSTGFTIIELIVSIVIIGILASIAVVSYPGIKKQMTISQMNADLRTAATQLARDFSKNGKYPDTKEESGDGKGLTSSAGITLTYNYKQATNMYCLSATNGDTIYHIDVLTKTVSAGACGTPIVLGNMVSTIAGSGTGAFLDSIGTLANLNVPSAITIDSSGTNIYFTDSWNNRVRKMNLATSVVTTIAGSGASVVADGVGSGASFLYPNGIAVDSIGQNLYIIDNGGSYIRKVNIFTGEVVTIAGNSSNGYSDGVGSSATFNYARAIAIDPDDSYLYVADGSNHKIRRIDLSSYMVTTYTGGSAGNVNGALGVAQFSYLSGITIDSVGANMYVSEGYGTNSQNRIRKIDMNSGIVSLLAGSSANSYGDGVGIAAKFYLPRGLDLDPTNTYLYVADYENQRIRRIETSTGIVITIAGGDTGAYLDGLGAAARFKHPYDLVTNPVNSQIYVVDTENNRIRLIR